jgi:hypothetical protein
VPPAARNLFEKRFLDFQKLFIKVFLLPCFFAFLRVPSRLKKIGGELRESKKQLPEGYKFPDKGTGQLPGIFFLKSY